MDLCSYRCKNYFALLLKKLLNFLKRSNLFSLNLTVVRLFQCRKFSIYFYTCTMVTLMYNKNSFVSFLFKSTITRIITRIKYSLERVKIDQFLNDIEEKKSHNFQKRIHRRSTNIC